MTKLQSVHSILIIYGVAFNLPNQKSWNDTENVWEDQFLNNIERVDSGITRI